MIERGENEYDVAVVGGGITGLVFAALLARTLEATNSRRRLALIEVRPPEQRPADAPLDLRVSALATASENILRHLKVWQQLSASRMCAFDRMAVWQAGGAADGARSISFDAAENGQANLGHIVENQALREALWANLQQSEHVSLLQATPEALAQEAEGVVVRLDNGNVIRSGLVVGADGARSWVRQQAGIEFSEREYAQHGVVAHVRPERPHGQTAWQRFLPDGPVALLPLADGRCSIVWSCNSEQAEHLCACDENTFVADLEAATDSALGVFECTTPRVSFPLAMGYARSYTTQRVVLVGDAAHRVHPLAGQGANLGMLDAAVLAELLGEQLQSTYADAGDQRLLRRYERARKGDNLLTMGAMDVLQRIFSPPFSDMAGTGLQLVDQVPLLKARFAAYATGHGRELPAAAQPKSNPS